jgi:hypothetical protein
MYILQCEYSLHWDVDDDMAKPAKIHQPFEED